MPYDPAEPVIDLNDINEVPEDYDTSTHKVVEEYIYDGNTKQKVIRITSYTDSELAEIESQALVENQKTIDARIIELKLLVIEGTATADQKTELSLLK